MQFLDLSSITRLAFMNEYDRVVPFPDRPRRIMYGSKKLSLWAATSAAVAVALILAAQRDVAIHVGLTA